MLVLTDSEGPGSNPFEPYFFPFLKSLFYHLFYPGVNIVSKIMWKIENKVYTNIKNAVCIIGYLLY